MYPIPKPSGFGNTESPDNGDHQRERVKPAPPSHLNCGTEAKTNAGTAKTRKKSSKTGNVDIRSFSGNEEPKNGTSATDFGVNDVFNVVKSLDANRYATKKTIAQGMLDIALLTANASQLKYILQVGKHHEFYTLMLSLICVSIGLQVLQGIIFVLLGSSFNINKKQDQPTANVWNNISLAMMLLTVAVNVIISAFEMRSDNLVVKAGSVDNITMMPQSYGIR